MGLAEPNRRRGGAQRATTSARAKGKGARATSSNGTLRFEFASDFDKGCAVQQRILEEVKRHGFNANSIFATRLALEEALVNAIKHGNKLDPAKKVIVEAKVTRKRVQIEVEDQGPGFDRRRVPDPTADENLCKCSGRGILLMESYMTSVKWTKNGRRVQLIKLGDGEQK